MKSVSEILSYKNEASPVHKSNGEIREGIVPPKIISDDEEHWLVEIDQKPRNWDSITGPKIRNMSEWVNWGENFLEFNPEMGGDESTYDAFKRYVETEADKYLEPNIKNGYEATPPRIIMHAATAANGNYKAEYTRAEREEKPASFDTWTGGRAGFFAKEGDLVVGRGLKKVIGEPENGVDFLEVGFQDFYYTYDAIAEWAETDPDFDNPENPIPKLLEFIHENPDVSMSVYASGLEEQAVLLYLQKMSGIDKLKVEANSSESTKLNTKDILYSELDELLRIEAPVPKTPKEVNNLIYFEKLSSPLIKTFGSELLDLLPGVPGCAIRKNDDFDSYKSQIMNLRKYFIDRYGITKICAKPSVSSDGERIVFDLDPRNKEQMEELAEDLFELNENYIFEPHLNFTQYDINGDMRPIVPSTHIIDGFSMFGMGTNQKIYPGGVWGGHELLDRENAKKIGVTELFDKINLYMDHMATVAREKDIGLSLAGIDFYEGTVESLNPAVAGILWQGPGDPNIRITGATYVYASFEKVAEEYMKEAGIKIAPGDVGVSTRIFLPHGDYDVINTAVQEFKEQNLALEEGTTFGTVAVGSENWAMVYASGADVNKSAMNVEKLVEYLEEKGIKSDIY